MPKDYYLVMGIPADSTQQEIKAAYRRLAKEFHPDRCRDRHTPFLGIQEAYGVLGDPVRRREYDEARREAGRREAGRGHTSSFAGTVEPLIPEGEAASGRAPFSRSFGPDAGGLFDRMFGSLFRLEPAGSRRQGGWAIEVAVTPQQAYRGGAIRLVIPVRTRCPSCGGSGGMWFHACLRCGGSGSQADEYPLRLEFPPGIPDDSIFRVPLDRLGLGNSWLTLRFRIQS